VDVYLLWHIRPLEGQEALDPELNHIETEDKLCGAYSSETKAREAQSQLVLQPGFKDYPDDFYVAAYRIDEPQWTDGFITV